VRRNIKYRGTEFTTSACVPALGRTKLGRNLRARHAVIDPTRVGDKNAVGIHYFHPPNERGDIYNRSRLLHNITTGGKRTLRA